MSVQGADGICRLHLQCLSLYNKVVVWDHFFRVFLFRKLIIHQQCQDAGVKSPTTEP